MSSRLVSATMESTSDYFPPEVAEEFDRIGKLLYEFAQKHGIEFLLAIASSTEPPDVASRPEFQVNLTSASVYGTSRLGLCSNWLGGEICPHAMAYLVASMYGDQCQGDDQATEHELPEVH